MPQLYPLMICSEHYMPERYARIRGQGSVFIASLRAAEKAGGMWLAFQDSNGNSAVKQGDIVSFAQISHIDWLSQAEIVVECKVLNWGQVCANALAFSNEWMAPCIRAESLELWPKLYKQRNTNALQLALEKINLQYPELKASDLQENISSECVKQLCWRWLELLPLPINTKQRLLKSPSASLCIRYLGFILRQSDRFNHLPR
ncbi:hypothetical protein [Agarivorans sp. DSG3-1]|uniref:hypothetical protein n=1 Tax=Agarivorans sp. DSG3-1 TaxID=3342249 RepID=UPI00398E46C6